MFDDSTDPYDHMLHYNQEMTLNAGNNLILCKVFLSSLHNPALAWFHKLPRSSINSFNELWIVFISQHLSSLRQKRNISSLQNILKHEEESIRDFTRRFGQAVQQIEFYNMDTVLQNFRRSFRPTSPFFHSLSLDPPATMEELYRWADRYSTLEDNIRVATQVVMITSQPTEKDKLVLTIQYIYTFITLLPKDYCLIPGNGAIKLDELSQTKTYVYKFLTLLPKDY